MRFIIIIIFIFSYAISYSQSDSVPLMFRKITAEQGLPHNFVRAITQDNKGFMWIGTNYGLARYDGYDFKVFLPDPLKPFSISNKSIDGLFSDSKSNLWVSFSSGGLSKMELNTEKFTFYNYDARGRILLSRSNCIFLEDIDADIWVASSTGIYMFNILQDKFINAFSKKNFNIENNRVYSFTSDLFGRIWFVRDNKLWILDKKTFNITSIGGLTTNLSLDTLSYLTVYSKDKSEIWMSCKGKGLFCFHVKTGRLDTFLENKGDFENIFLDRKGNLFAIPNNVQNQIQYSSKENIGKKIFTAYSFAKGSVVSSGFYAADDQFGNVYLSSKAGLLQFNKRSGITHIETNFFNPSSIADNRIEYLFIDKTDNLWLSPHRKGINKADLRQKPINLLRPSICNLNDIQKDNNISSVLEDSKGNVWMGNSNGTITIYENVTGRNFLFSFNSTSITMSIYEDSDSNIYLGSNESVLFKVKIPQLANRNPSLDQTFDVIERIEQLNGRKVCADKNNNLWFAGNNGLLELKKDSSKGINLSIEKDSMNKMSDFYRTVYVSRNQIVWTGSNSGGLCKYDPSTRQFKHYLNDKNNNKSISNNTVYSIIEDKNGFLWMGTRQGLEKFDPKIEQFEHIGGDDLFKRSLFSIFPDANSNYWMSSDVGIICYDIKTQKTSFYGQWDGLRGNELSTSASFMNKNGKIYFGGTEGVVSFYPSEFKNNPIYAKPVITNFRIANKVISPGDRLHGRVIMQRQVWETSEIELFYSENDFTIEFSGLHFSAPEKNQYEYKLEGLNDEWIHTDAKRRYASYTGLPHGEYTFVLRATNNDGLMCDEKDEVRFSITITPPFWLKWWFKTLFILVVIGGILAYFYKRTTQLKRLKQILEIKVTQRTADLNFANTDLKERQAEILLQAEELVVQKDVLTEYSKKVSEQNEQIKSSLRYAQTIQQSILPSTIWLDERFENFIIYKPKDIVSGDFYWFTELKIYDKAKLSKPPLLMVVVDCTGHGVPGAFMSMISNRIITQLVNERNVCDPSAILEALDEEIQIVLNQKQGGNNDGMDLSICVLEYQNDASVQLTFSGAKSSIYYSDSQQIEIQRAQGSHRSIGGFKLRKGEPFTNKTISLQKNDSVYLTTDGFIDQNNETRSRFGTKSFIECLTQNKFYPMLTQKEALETALREWQKNELQRDDITVIGIRI